MLIVSRSRRVDWPRMAANLQKQGMSWQEIADALGVTRGALPNWLAAEATGEPAFWVGSTMIILWCKRTGLQWTDIPLRQVAPSVSEVLRSSA